MCLFLLFMIFLVFILYSVFFSSLRLAIFRAVLGFLDPFLSRILCQSTFFLFLCFPSYYFPYCRRYSVLNCLPHSVTLFPFSTAVSVASYSAWYSFILLGSLEAFVFQESVLICYSVVSIFLCTNFLLLWNCRCLHSGSFSLEGSSYCYRASSKTYSIWFFVILLLNTPEFSCTFLGSNYFIRKYLVMFR